MTLSCGAEEPASLEERAQSIHKELICLQCPGETIDQSQVELADQMRGIVWEKLQAGWSREQILGYFVDRYGEEVLAAPPKAGFNLMVWVVPPIVLAGAGIVLLLIIRSMRTKDGDLLDPSEAEGMTEYLTLADAELKGTQEPGPSSAPSEEERG